jgi:hypothetical protein
LLLVIFADAILILFSIVISEVTLFADSFGVHRLILVFTPRCLLRSTLEVVTVSAHPFCIIRSVFVLATVNYSFLVVVHADASVGEVLKFLLVVLQWLLANLRHHSHHLLVLS